MIARQLDLFERDNPDVIEEARERLEAYNSAERDEAEELYGDYVDAVETGTELLADIRDTYARHARRGRRRAVRARVQPRRREALPAFALEIEHASRASGPSRDARRGTPEPSGRRPFGRRGGRGRRGEAPRLRPARRARSRLLRTSQSITQQQPDNAIGKRTIGAA